MTTSKGVLRKIEALGPLYEKLSKKGVKIRMAAPVTKETASAIKDILKHSDVRHISKIDARFVIIDSKELMFMLMDDKQVHPSYDIGVWVNTPYFAGALESLFSTAWKDLDPADKIVNKV